MVTTLKEIKKFKYKHKRNKLHHTFKSSWSTFDGLYKCNICNKLYTPKPPKYYSYVHKSKMVCKDCYDAYQQLTDTQKKVLKI